MAVHESACELPLCPLLDARVSRVDHVRECARTSRAGARGRCFRCDCGVAAWTAAGRCRSRPRRGAADRRPPAPRRSSRREVLAARSRRRPAAPRSDSETSPSSKRSTVIAGGSPGALAIETPAQRGIRPPRSAEHRGAARPRWPGQSNTEHDRPHPSRLLDDFVHGGDLPAQSPAKRCSSHGSPYVW